VGLQCFESQQKANNGDVDSSAELKALITQVGGSTNAQDCLDPHGENPDVPSFGPSYCFHSETTRSLSSFDCDQVPVPASENKQRLCYCADSEAPTTTAGPTTTAATAGDPFAAAAAAAAGTRLAEAAAAACSHTAQAILSGIDTDGNGSGSMAEFVAFGEASGNDGQRMHTQFDSDKDGKVSCAEIDAIVEP